MLCVGVCYRSAVIQESMTIEPTWYAEIVWKGDKPDSLLQEGQVPGIEASPKLDQEVVIEGVSGKIILNQLASGTGQHLSNRKYTGMTVR